MALLQAPDVQVSAVHSLLSLQLAQTFPATPHAAGDVPARHADPFQHPGQHCAE
jgi:hypothetical protein